MSRYVLAGVSFLPVTVYTTSTGGGCKVISSRVFVISDSIQWLKVVTMVCHCIAKHQEEQSGDPPLLGTANPHSLGVIVVRSEEEAEWREKLGVSHHRVTCCLIFLTEMSFQDRLQAVNIPTSFSRH